MCTVPKRNTALQMVVCVVALLIVLSSCGGTDYPAGSYKECKPVAVPITDMRRVCHPVGNDECAFITTDMYTYTAVGYDCKENK